MLFALPTVDVDRLQLVQVRDADFHASSGKVAALKRQAVCLAAHAPGGGLEHERFGIGRVRGRRTCTPEAMGEKCTTALSSAESGT